MQFVEVIDQQRAAGCHTNGVSRSAMRERDNTIGLLQCAETTKVARNLETSLRKLIMVRLTLRNTPPATHVIKRINQTLMGRPTQNQPVEITDNREEEQSTYQLQPLRPCPRHITEL